MTTVPERVSIRTKPEWADAPPGTELRCIHSSASGLYEGEIVSLMSVYKAGVEWMVTVQRKSAWAANCWCARFELARGDDWDENVQVS